MNESDAIARLRRGDISGLEALVEAYQVRAVRIAALITGDRARAADVVQAAFLRAFQRIDQFDPARPFGPWFLTIVANDARKAASRGRRDLSLDADDTPLPDLLPGPIAELPEQAAERAELRESLRRTLGRLSPEQRAVVVMRYVLGLSEAEMAAGLDLPRSTVKGRLHAARTKLRVWLRPLWERK